VGSQKEERQAAWKKDFHSASVDGPDRKEALLGSQVREGRDVEERAEKRLSNEKKRSIPKRLGVEKENCKEQIARAETTLTVIPSQTAPRPRCSSLGRGRWTERPPKVVDADRRRVEGVSGYGDNRACALRREVKTNDESDIPARHVEGEETSIRGKI